MIVPLGPMMVRNLVIQQKQNLHSLISDLVNLVVQVQAFHFKIFQKLQKQRRRAITGDQSLLLKREEKTRLRMRMISSLLRRKMTKKMKMITKKNRKSMMKRMKMKKKMKKKVKMRKVKAQVKKMTMKMMMKVKKRKKRNIVKSFHTV